MTGAVVFVYGMLLSFVLSGTTRNAKLKRPNPPMMTYVGYVLCGISAGLSIALFAHAISSAAGFPLI